MDVRVIVDRDVMVPMRDGVAIATDVYRPAGDGKHPVLVHRTPYGKSTAINVASRFFNPLNAVQRGYCVVIQDVRGRYKSGGEWQPFRNEINDGYDAVEWAAIQPWCDGGAAVYGGSYVGLTALHAVVAQPPHLKAAMVSMFTSNPHDCWTYVGGAFELGFNLFWVASPFWGLAWDALNRLPLRKEEIAEGQAQIAKITADPWGAVNHLPITDQVAFQNLAPYWNEWLNHPTYDDYWKSSDVLATDVQINVPVLNLTGWYDLFLRGALDLHQYLETHSTESVRDSHRFVIGPWDHASHLNIMPSSAGVWDFGPEALAGPLLWTDLVLNFFDQYLKPEGSGAAPPQKVRYYMMGENHWVDGPCWPPQSTSTSFYLHSGGSANTAKGDGMLSTESPVNEPADRFVYDPADPVPTAGGRVLFYHFAFGGAGVADQSKVEERRDVLVYSTPPLASAVPIGGHVSVTLYASTDALDTDFTAKLVDAQPDGFSANIAEGIIRARYRDGQDTESLLQPGRIYEFTIDMWDVAHSFAAGHCIRLEISSSNYPHFNRNLNSEVNPTACVAEDMKVATQRVFHTPEHSSRLTLPILVQPSR